MAKITFYPVGKGDAAYLEFDDGRNMVLDYCHRRIAEDPNDPRIDLAKELRGTLAAARRNDVDVLAFSHLDDDHCAGAKDFFWLDYAQKYQGADRTKAKELWVPDCAIIEPEPTDESRPWREEAKFRLKRGTGIKVFSRPERVKDWLESQGLTIESRRNCFVDAGTLVPGFSVAGAERAEIFVHSPFAARIDADTVVDRNGSSIVLQLRYLIGGAETRVLLTGDIRHEDWEEIVRITELKQRGSRLQWDIIRPPHHCSYTGIGPEKGKDITVPTKRVDRVYRTYGVTGGLIVASTNPIPLPGSEADDDVQPPHRQAANYYRAVAKEKDGEFKVTMEEPSTRNPKPMIIEIDANGWTRQLPAVGVGAILTSRPPRAG